jgi:DNA-binding NarL/FixJ family response regulator
MTKRVLIADDHPLFREALTLIVQSSIDDLDIHQTTDYLSTGDELAKNSYDLVFIDLNMPDSNGLMDVALLKKQHPNTPFVVVSADSRSSSIKTCMSNNISGYIIKSSQPAEIKRAIQVVLAGETYIPNSDELEIDEKEDFSDKLNLLTPSQLNILMEIGKGKLNKQIAYDLEIKEATVKAHITSIFKKLGINNRTQAVLLVKEHIHKPV